MRKLILVFFAVFLISNLASAQTKDEGVDLTIYNQNFGLVKDRRVLNLEKGTSQIKFSDVASQIEPTSVHFKSVTSPESCEIQEQNYEYDLVGASKLLNKYIDKKIKILTEEGTVYEGILMSYDGDNIIIADPSDKSLDMINRKDNIRTISFTELPEGLITKPTLMWQIANDKPGKHLAEVSYLTQGINWLCDYVAVIDKDDKNIDLSGWVTIDNKSGTTYKNAGLKLIAGEVHRAEEKKVYAGAGMMRDESRAAAPQFEEKAFFEYHMYTLQRRTTVKDNQTKQITLLTANNVPVKKLFIYDPAKDYGWYYYQETETTKEQKVKVKLEIENKKENNLGMPLPKGKVKVYKKDVDEALEFIGEDSIDHTPKDEKIRIVLGDAFDVVGERKRIDYKNPSRDVIEETYEISLRNHKEEDIEVIVVEHLWRYSNWKILSNSHDFTKKDAQTIEFMVPVPKNGETKIKYTVHYWWK